MLKCDDDNPLSIEALVRSPSLPIHSTSNHGAPSLWSVVMRLQNEIKTLKMDMKHLQLQLNDEKQERCLAIAALQTQHFLKDAKEIEAHRLLVEAYNEAALSERTCREWFQKFKNGDFDAEDKYCSGRPNIYEDAELEELLEEYSSQTQKEFALTLRVTQQTVSHSLKSLGIIHKQGFPVKNYLKTLDWEVLPHPPYSTDIAPSDDHLFWSMAHALLEQRFTSYEDTKNWVDSWIVSKDKEFFKFGIRTQPEKWKKVVASDGRHFD
ncbi:Mariner Mos1 transposase [Eumeta japonica]|uniref:Mariner Mos1 transposase n=1 Tax=Eumeta variegata TaxID=151549 RepID=A0A4C1UCU6_EUMVA|nr:Mariner Mos1 transposase [Eumeta japonica]